MNVYTILSDILKFERHFAVFGLIAFAKVLSMDSRYVGSEGSGGGMGTSPLEKVIVLLLYAVEGISLLLIIFRWRSVVRRVLRDPFLWGLAGMALFSFIWSDFPGLSRNRGISTLQTALFGLYLTSRFSPKEQLYIMADAIGIISVYIFLYTGAFPGAAREQGVHAGSWRGPLVHKNLLAQLMTCGIIPTLLAALDSQPKDRFRLWTFFGLTLVLVVLTTSKTGIIITLSILVLVPLFNAMRWRGGLLIPLVITIVLMSSSAITWLANNWEPFLYGIGKDPTLSGRTYLWEAAIEKIQQRPWLGYGYQAFWQSSGGAEYVWTAVKYKASHSHNGFVNIALDVGLVGLFFFVTSVLTMYIRGVAWLRMGNSFAELLPVLYASFLLLYNQTESTIIEHNSIFWILHVTITLSIGYYRKLTPEEKASREYLSGANKLAIDSGESIRSSGIRYEK